MNNLECGDYCHFTTHEERNNVVTLLKNVGIEICDLTFVIMDEVSDFHSFPYIVYVGGMNGYVMSVNNRNINLKTKLNIGSFMIKSGLGPRKTYIGNILKFNFI